MATREARFVEHDGVRIEVLAEGVGRPVVLLPSLGRDSYDYDDVAEGLAANGFRVLRPLPRGMGRSTGPMENLTLHDFARDVSATYLRLSIVTLVLSWIPDVGLLVIHDPGATVPAVAALMVMHTTTAIITVAALLRIARSG